MGMNNRSARHRDELRVAELSDGPIEYIDVGEGPTVVLVHGVWMNASQWGPVIEQLRPDFRCIAPNLPLGAHRTALHPDADVSLRGHADRLTRFLDKVAVDDATVAFNDWCAAQIIIADGATDRVGRLVFVSCETDDNYPPGLPGRMLAVAGAVPGGIFISSKLLRLRIARRLPFTFGWMSNRRVPSDVMDDWFAPARKNPATRRDLRRYAGDTRRGKRALGEATAALRHFDKPVLVVWGRDDRVMPIASGRRLASVFPRATFVDIPDAGTLVPWDQPVALADEIARFVQGASGQRR